MEKKHNILLSATSMLFVVALIFVSKSCLNEDPKIPGDEESAEPGNEVAIAWNNMAYTIANQHDQFYSFIGVRALGMTHLAIHDALNAISKKYEPYAFEEKEPDADPIAASSQAAYEVLISVYPQREDTLKTELNRWLSAIDDPKAKELGINLGKKSAAAIVQLREDDEHAANGTYQPTGKPGAYQYTPGHTTVWIPDFTRVKTFALQSLSQFRAPAPPAISTIEYANDYNEVKAFGSHNSAVRTIEQTNYAHWWAEFGEHSWNRIVRITAKEQKLPLWETARLFALININLYDLYLASFESKYTYDTWRPYTAVHNGEKDDNPATTPDTTWQPEMVTPPWPDYPSTHAGVGAGGAEIVSHAFGTSDVAFEMESVTALPTAKTRSYTNLDSAANDCARSRIMNGYHFRFATEQGKNQGRTIAKYIYLNYLKAADSAKTN